MVDLDNVLAEAARLVTPSPEEASMVNDIANFMVSLLNRELGRVGVSAQASVQGSVAHGTWLPGDRDIDIFIVFPRDERYVKLIEGGEVLRIITNILDSNGIGWRVNYAQHPYVVARYRGFDVDIVPCIEMRMGERPLTAADRTPLHTEFLRGRLRGLENDVRLLKLFMKSIGVYGAEIKVQGFSGYLAELLVVNYGGFINVVKAASSWIPYRVRINMGGSCETRHRAPLVITDPVDPCRNVAAAVSLRSMSVFIAASRAFLRRPSIAFFTSPKTPKPLLTAPVLVVFGKYPQGVVEDVVWGQLRSIASSLWNIVRRAGFKPMDIDVYASENGYMALAMMVEAIELPPYELHVGPPVWSDDSEAFLEKYVLRGDVAGPFIANGRWLVVRGRAIRHVSDVVLNGLKSLGRGVVRDSLLSGTMVIVKDEDSLSKIPKELMDFLYRFLNKRPHWLAYQ